jgi:alanyl-tRNA synthetase
MGRKEPFLHLLVPKVAEMMAVPYPDLSETTDRVAKVIATEEEHFLGTVESGLARIERIFEKLDGRQQTAGETADGRQQTAAEEGGVAATCMLPSAVCNLPSISGTEIFDMYQTFGFPPELFETMATEHGFGFDWTGFKREMEHHGEISGSTEKNLLFKDDPLAEIKKKHKTEFVVEPADTSRTAKVIAILVDGKLVDSISDGQTARVILDRTSFYGERGGQVGDIGHIVPVGTENGQGSAEFTVEDTKMDGDLIVHIGRWSRSVPGIPDLKVGDRVYPCVNNAHRMYITRAHTATHLLHHVLRQTLGSHAEQQGSKVDADVLRFDFTHHQAVDKETLHEIELAVNRLIDHRQKVWSQEMYIDEARKPGVMMLFGEKYPERVRVVGIGVCEGNSKELCGGTHVRNTTEIRCFKIISEESVSAGVRRITALTGMKAVEKAQSESAIVHHLATTLKIPAEEIPAKVESLMEQVKKLQKQVKTAGKTADGRRQTAEDLINGAEVVGAVKLITAQLPDVDINTARQLIDQIRQKTDNVAILFALLQEEGKITLLAGVSRELTSKYDAEKWVKSLTPLIGGKGGGGRPDMAQGGGNDATKLPAVFEAAKKFFG